MREFKTRLEPFGRGFANCDGKGAEYRVAAGIYNACKEIKLTVDDLGLCYKRLCDLIDALSGRM